MSERIVVTGLGDSITAGNPAWDPDPERRALKSFGDDETSQYLYWAAQKDERIVFRNLGVGGERTDEIRSRLEGAVEGTDVLIVQGGINDVVQGRPVDLAAADLEYMVRRARALGLSVLLPDVLPWNNGWPDAEPEIRRLNELIHALAVQVDGVTPLPFHDTLEDADHPGRMRAEWTDDGNHPSVAGHRRLGEYAFRLPG